MNRRAFLSSVSATALLTALPLPLVMGRVAKAVEWLPMFPPIPMDMILLERRLRKEAMLVCGIPANLLNPPTALSASALEPPRAAAVP